jgi:NitT/TauT family transport system substrate-binding protein
MAPDGLEAFQRKETTVRSSAAILVATFLLGLLSGCSKQAGPSPESGGKGEKQVEKIVVRMGHFPNVTHAQALVAHRLSRLAASGKGKGWFEERLGENVTIQWYVYNAGPSAMEAIFAGSLDLTYVGPSPALNAFARSKGEEIRIISGSALGGSALVVQPDGRIKAPADFKGKKVATPQLGNTQDVALRDWLIAQGFKVTLQGGDVQVLPTANPDQLSLFKEGQLDAVWTVEPWISRLEMEAKGEIFLEEKDAMTTILTSSVKFLKERPELAHKIAEAQKALTEWIVKNPAEAQQLVMDELKEETSREIPRPLVERSWSRLTFTSEVDLKLLERFLQAAKKVGFLTEVTDISRMVVTP